MNKGKKNPIRCMHNFDIIRVESHNNKIKSLSNK